MPNTLDRWTRRELLILGSTYPTYSRKHWETACTGAMDKHTHELVRIYPLPRRYMDASARFKNFQWITVECSKSSSDPRPESLRINPETVVVGREIPSTEPEERASLLERSPHLFPSLRALKAAQQASGVSLGIVRPRSIEGVRLRNKEASARREWEEREAQILNQPRLQYMLEPMRLAFIDVDIMVRWTDEEGDRHDMALRTWGLSELYRRYRDQPGGREKVRLAALKQLDRETRDVFMFLGSFHNHPQTFGLMDAYCPKKVRQRNLFG